MFSHFYLQGQETVFFNNCSYVFSSILIIIGKHLGGAGEISPTSILSVTSARQDWPAWLYLCSFSWNNVLLLGFFAFKYSFYSICYSVVWFFFFLHLYWRPEIDSDRKNLQKWILFSSLKPFFPKTYCIEFVDRCIQIRGISKSVSFINEFFSFFNRNTVLAC